jgi:hypothetical protein
MTVLFEAVVPPLPPHAASVKRANGDKLRAVLFLSIAMDTLCYDLSG